MRVALSQGKKHTVAYLFQVIKSPLAGKYQSGRAQSETIVTTSIREFLSLISQKVVSNTRQVTKLQTYHVDIGCAMTSPSDS